MLKLEIEKNRLFTTIVSVIYREFGAIHRSVMPSKGVLSIRSQGEYDILFNNLSILLLKRLYKWHDYYALIKLKSSVNPDMPSGWVINNPSTDKLCNDDKLIVVPDSDTIIDLLKLLDNDTVKEPYQTDPTSISISATKAEYGTVTAVSDTSIKYRPPADYTGWDRIQYSVTENNLKKTDFAYLYLQVAQIPPSFSTIESSIPTDYKRVNLPSLEKVKSSIKLTDVIQYSKDNKIFEDNRPTMTIHDLDESEWLYPDVYDDTLRTVPSTEEIVKVDPVTGELVKVIDTFEYPELQKVYSTVLKSFSTSEDLIWTYRVSDDGQTQYTLDLKPYLVEWTLPPLKLIYKDSPYDGLNNPVRLAINKQISMATSHAHNIYATSNIEIDIQIINTGTDEEPVYYFEVLIKNNTLNSKVLNLKSNALSIDNKPRQLLQYVSRDDLTSHKGKDYYEYVRLLLVDDLRQVLSIH